MSDTAMGCGGAIAGGIAVVLVVGGILNGLHAIAPNVFPDADGNRGSDSQELKPTRACEVFTRE